MKTRSLPQRIAWLSRSPGNPRQEGKNPVYRAEETVMRRGNDDNGVIEGLRLRGLSIRRGESHLNAQGDGRKTWRGDPAQTSTIDIQI
jgi:hypothetical protein